jgi:hypothetical protein
MTCQYCHKRIPKDAESCPHCRKPATSSGVFQTSTVLIFESGGSKMFGSVQEVPARLRTRLLRSTNGSNAATILIADRRGRREIAKAMRKLSSQGQQRITAALLGLNGTSRASALLTPGRRKALVTAVFLIAIALIGFVFLRTFH